ncbi:MAG: transcriptional repressor [Bacteroidales bacterium]|nr:transcriptional repressor [Candidatus Equimonas enterica]
MPIDAHLLLRERGVRPTANRLLVLREMLAAGYALSNADLEARLGTLDRSSVYRVLTVFLAHHLVHAVDDGTGQTKYAVCAPDCHCGEDPHSGLRDLHPHFYCERCRRTYCLPTLGVPEVMLPTGFHLHSAAYVLRGLCPDCLRHGCRAHAD